MTEAITYRAGLHSLDSAGAHYKFRNGQDYLSVSVDPDRFASMGRPGWIEIVVTPIGGTR